MPELPEVETLRQDLSKELVGKKIKSVAVTNGRSVRRHASAKAFRSHLEGTTVKSVARMGKYLLVTLDSKETLVIHLGMSGQLLRAKSVKEPKPKHTHVVVTFTQGGELRYVDPRTFGEMFVSVGEDGVPAEGLSTPPPSAAAAAKTTVTWSGSGWSGPGGQAIDTATWRKKVPELAHLGFDPIEDMMSWDRFAVLLRMHKTGLKMLMMDQDFVAGIGNIYSDEILFAAGLRYDRPSDGLSAIETRRLYRSVVETLAEAIKHRGSTLADEQFCDLFGEPGHYQQSHEVYDREGQPCRRCRAPIVRSKVGGRSTFYCEHCQI